MQGKGKKKDYTNYSEDMWPLKWSITFSHFQSPGPWSHISKFMTIKLYEAKVLYN